MWNVLQIGSIRVPGVGRDAQQVMYTPALSPGPWPHQVTKRNLEVLRALKNRMVRLFTRVETIRELLERLLDDDSDMRDMNLTAKCAKK